MTTSVCALDPSFQRDGWDESIIEAFDHAAPSSALEICASLFRTSAGAHSAYSLLVKRDIAGPLSLKMVKRLKMKRIGNESSATWKGLKDCSCTASATGHTYQMVMRHDNAVVELMYAGPLWATPDRFHLLAATINGRLR